MNEFLNMESNAHFATVPNMRIPHSKISRVSKSRGTMDVNMLYPIYYDDFYPGENLQMDIGGFLRMNPTVTPYMDNLYLDVLAFAVPHRICWEHWKEMFGETSTPTQINPTYVLPTVTAPTDNGFVSPKDSEGNDIYTSAQVATMKRGFGFDSIYDYFGIRPDIAGIEVNSLPFRAYNKIYNHWLRDENLIDAVPEVFGDIDDWSNYKLLKSGKRHDYFTSCTVNPYKGFAVTLPLGNLAPVIGNGLALGFTDGDKNYGLGSINGYANSMFVENYYGNEVNNTYLTPTAYGKNGYPMALVSDSEKSGLVADLSNTQGATIAQFRTALQTYAFFERDNVCGTRYVEKIQGHFGINSPDARLQRPEFIGGATTEVNCYSVAQTSSTNATTPQANLTAYSTFELGKRNFINKTFTEHTMVIILARVRADLTYQQGVPFNFLKRGQFDYMFPLFNGIGDRAVTNAEIFAQGTDEDNDVFGYQERYAELRYKPNQIVGRLRSDHPISLDLWHFAQQFENLPKLNQSFIEENVPIDRVLAVTNEPAFIFSFQFNEQDLRAIPVASVPAHLGL